MKRVHELNVGRIRCRRIGRAQLHVQQSPQNPRFNFSIWQGDHQVLILLIDYRGVLAEVLDTIIGFQARLSADDFEEPLNQLYQAANETFVYVDNRPMPLDDWMEANR